MFSLITAAVFAAMLASGPVAGQPRRGLGRPSGPPPRQLLERLNRMTPAERERVLSKLPPDRRSVLERRLQRLDRLPPDQKQRLGDQYVLFRMLPENRQDEVRSLFREFSDLPQNRRTQLRREIVALRNLLPAARSARMTSEAFESEYEDHERTLLKRIVDLLPEASNE